MPTITQLEYLVAVDKEKHFGKAALLCHVSQPSLSAQIQKLEDELDTIVFDRSKKPILCTEIGKQIIAQAKVILKEHKKLIDLASEVGHEAKGEFNLAVIPTLSPYLIPLFIGEFSKKYPKVALKISETKTEDIIQLLIKDEIDAGLLVTPLHDDRLIERHLFFEPFYAYIAVDHPLNKKKSLAESDLENKSLWLLEEGHCFRNQVLKVCSLNNKKPVLPNVEFTSGNLETLKNLIRKNSGYTLLPELALAGLTDQDIQNHIRTFKNPVPTREVSLVYSRSFLKETIIEALEQSIIQNLPKRIKSLKKSDLDIIEIE